MDPTVDVARAYGSGVREYENANPDRTFAEPMLEWLTNRLRPGSRIIDLGCGPGWEVERLEDLGYQALGLDLTPAFVVRARTRYSSASYVAGDFRALPLASESFDGAFSSSAYVHVRWAEIDLALAGVARVLRRGGFFVMSMQAGSSEGAVASCSLSDQLLHYAYYEPEDWQSRLERAGFEVVELRFHESAPEHCNPGAYGWIEALARRR